MTILGIIFLNCWNLLLNRWKCNLAWNTRPQFHSKIHIDRLIVPHCGARSQTFDLISNFSLGQYQDFQVSYQYDWSMRNLAWNIQSPFHTEIDTDQLPLWVNKDVIWNYFYKLLVGTTFASKNELRCAEFYLELCTILTSESRNPKLAINLQICHFLNSKIILWINIILTVYTVHCRQSCPQKKYNSVYYRPVCISLLNTDM